MGQWCTTMSDQMNVAAFEHLIKLLHTMSNYSITKVKPQICIKHEMLNFKKNWKNLILIES